jgi:hypothetical protein
MGNFYECNPGEAAGGIMNWQEIRQLYPHRWLVVEAIGAYTEGTQRIIPHLAVLGEFAQDHDSARAFYRETHRLNKMRELYVLHTDREELHIRVMNAFRIVIEE